MNNNRCYNYIKRLLPSSVRRNLSFIKRGLVHIIEQVLVIRGWLWKKHNNINHNGLISVCFITVEPQTWNSLKPIYDILKEDDRFIATIITVPNKDGIKEMKTFLRSVNYEAIDAFEDGKVLDIRTLSPDIIFIQTPYDWMYPISYRTRNLVKYAKICYVPYCYGLSSGEHQDIEFNINFLANVSCIFASNSFEYEYCSKKINKSKFTQDIKIFDVGYPRFDICIDEVTSMKARTFTWLPRWNFDESRNNKSSFLKYYKLLKDYFDIHKEVRLIIRPHPMMFDYILNNGILSIEEVNQIKNEVKMSDNVEFDTEFDYYETFLKTDVLISDFSSLLAEFYFMKKPIMYCGEYTGYNTVTARMLDEFIRIDSNEKLIYNLDHFQESDYYNENRCKGNAISGKNNEMTSSKQISDICYSLICAL